MSRPSAAALAMLLLALSPGAQAGMPAPQQDNVMTSTSEPDLRRLIPVAGQPRAVLWADETIRPANADSFPPGPGDTRLVAMLTYGSAVEVAAIIGDGPAEPAEMAAPAWFPEGLAPGGTLKAVRHYRVAGFADAAVMTLPDAPGIVILQRGPS